MNNRSKVLGRAEFGALIGAILASLVVPCQAREPTASPSRADTSVSNSVENPEAILTEVVVTAKEQGGIAGGLMKIQTAAETMSSITPTAIAEKLSVASPLQLAATIPGVNFGSSDAYGLSIRNFLTMRGLDETEIGFMVANIPGNDLLNYDPYAETWADNENISDITVTPGNSRLQDPIVNASGGEFIESIREPRDRFGGMVDGSVGSYDGRRGFVDIDTGYIGNTGAKAFLSYSYTRAHNYVGPGTNTRDHVDFKIVEDWTSKIHSNLFFSYNNWANARINILSLAQAEKGISSDNLEQYQYAPTFVPGVTSNYYKLAIARYKHYLAASDNVIGLTDHVTLHVVPYFRTVDTLAGGESTLNPNAIFSGTEMVTAVYNPASLQDGKLFTTSNVLGVEHWAGVNSYLEAGVTPDNYLIAGYWHEDSRLKMGDYYYGLNQAGDPIGGPLYSTGGTLVANVGLNWNAGIATNEVYVGDTQSLFDDKLQISVGFKNMFYSVDGANHVIGVPPTFHASWSEPMPRFLVSYDVSPKTQLYANVTTNARMPNVFATDITYTSGGHIAMLGNTSTKPEYTISEQVGYRYHGLVNIDASVFNMHLENHQVASGVYINGNLQPTDISIGGERIRGASLEVATQSYAGFSIYGNAQYADGTFDDNYPIDGDYLPTRGKQMVETPHWIANVGGRYDHGALFAEVTEKYVSDQYTAFMNNQSMPSYRVADLAVGYRLPDLGALKEPVIRLNLTNLADKPYISTGASVVPTAVAVHGINGTPIAAGTPGYYVAAPLAVMVTLSSRF